jgi:hypothetical protein
VTSTFFFIVTLIELDFNFLPLCQQDMIHFHLKTQFMTIFAHVAIFTLKFVNKSFPLVTFTLLYFFFFKKNIKAS